MKNITAKLLIVSCFIYSCTTKTGNGTADSASVKTERIRRTAIASLHAFEKGDMVAIKKYCAPGFVELGNGNHPSVTSFDSIKVYLQTFISAFPDMKVTDLKTYVTGDTVIITDVWSGTFTKPLFNIKPNGKMFKYPDVEILAFNKDGRIISHRAIQSDVTFYGQLGLAVPADK